MVRWSCQNEQPQNLALIAKIFLILWVHWGLDSAYVLQSSNRGDWTAAPVNAALYCGRRKEKTKLILCTGSWGFCPEVMHIISTHISLAGASHFAIPDFKWAGKYNPTICLEEERSGTFVTNLKAFLNMVKSSKRFGTGY